VNEKVVVHPVGTVAKKEGNFMKAAKQEQRRRKLQLTDTVVGDTVVGDTEPVVEPSPATPAAVEADPAWELQVMIPTFKRLNSDDPHEHVATCF
jgi:hypothetical protein